MADRIWINGDLVDASEAALSVLDHGVTVGDGVFETLKVFLDADHRPQAFALTRHLRRLRHSAAGLGLAIPLSDDELRTAVRTVLDTNDPTPGRLRLTVTGGQGAPGSIRPDASPTVMVTSSPLTPWPASAAVVTVPWRRNEHSPLAGLKTTSYAENVVAIDYARQRGAGEALFANTAGQLCEGASSNVFVGVGGRLFTPPLRSGCLAGITRELIVEILEVVEDDLPFDVLARADEVFLTSSTRDVQPVSTVDDRALPACPGPLTTKARTALNDLQATTLDP